MKKLRVPKFATEAQEAKWWDRHMEVVEANLVAAMRKGSAHTEAPLRVLPERRESKNITIRLAVADIERARALAAKEGIGYQTLIKMLLREGLDRHSETFPGRRRTKAG